MARGGAKLAALIGVSAIALAGESARAQTQPLPAATRAPATTGDQAPPGNTTPVVSPTPAPPGAPPPVSTPATAMPAAPATKLNPTGRVISLTVPLRSTVPLGQVAIEITPDDHVSVSSTDLGNALERFVRPEVIAKLRATAGPSGQIDTAAIAQLGFKLTYDPTTVEMVIDIPVDAYSSRSLTFGLQAPEDQVLPDRSSGFAAYLNYRAGLLYQISGPDRGDVDLLADLELGGRIGQTIAFDNFATIDPTNDKTFTRVASRIFYDLPGPALRFTAGDLITDTVGFQADPQIAGLNVSHLINQFYPGAPISGVSSRTLVLNRESDVQIIVNGVPVSQIHLGPGSYDLRNLPVAQGANNLQAVITDETGQRRVQNFNYFSSISLLNPGIDEFTLSAGVLAPLDRGGPHYTGRPALSGFYRRGLTNQLTLGANIQAAKRDQVIGVDGAYGTPIGLFSGNLAFNHLQGGKFGSAGRIQYSYAQDTNSVYISRTFDLSAEYYSKYFNALLGSDQRGPPDVTQALNVEKLLIAASVNQPISHNLTLQLNGTYAFNRSGFGDRGSFSALVTYQAPYRTTLGLGVSYQIAPKREISNITTGRGFSFLFTITHRFSASTLASATADRFNQRASFSRTPQKPLDDYFINGDFTHDRFGYNGNATAGYETNRGDVSATYSTVLDGDGHVLDQQAGGFFDGSIALAGSRIALGRHITDAFAIIGEDKSLGGRQVLVQSRFANTTVARSGTFGPAVVPLSSYERQVIPYDVKDLPPGYDLGIGNFELYPWYRSGFSLTVGSPYNITALGVLLDRAGQPVTLRTGQAISETDPKAPRVDIITNATGRFAALGLAPGRYRITMSGDSGLAYELTVAETPGMLLRAGTLQPEGPKGEPK